MNIQSNLDSKLQSALTMIGEASQVTVTMHANPDGDAIGSALAVYDYLKFLGKSCRIMNESETPRVLQFLDPSREIAVYNETIDYDYVDKSDLIIILDLNNPERLRSMKEAVLSSNSNVIVIDHHMEPKEFADLYVVDTDATSTGELVYKLLKKDESYKISNFAAYALYAAILTDTGSFRYPRTDAETHRIVADLIDCGADPVRIYDEIYNMNSISELRLLVDTYRDMKLYFNDFLCIMTISDAMLKKHHATNQDLEGFVEKTLAIRGVKIGVMLSEVKERNEIRLSLRSKDEFEVRDIANELGGGGHYHAAGARIKDASLEDVRSAVITYVASKYKFI